MNQILPLKQVSPKIEIQTIGLKGITGSYEYREGKPKQNCCRDTMPKYFQVIVGHDGRNIWLGDRQGWVTNIVRHEKIRHRDQKMENDVCVFIIRPEDSIFRITLCHAQMMVDGMSKPILGLWQLVVIKEPGKTLEIILPRLLLATEPMRLNWSEMN